MRRLFGIIICLLPICLFAASAISARRIDTTLPSLALTSLALLIAVANFFLAIVRPLWHKRTLGSMDDYKFVSGVPVVGTVFVVFGLAVGFSAVIPTCLAGLAIVLDTQGTPWLLLATWQDHSFWDD